VLARVAGRWPERVEALGGTFTLDSPAVRYHDHHRATAARSGAAGRV